MVRGHLTVYAREAPAFDLFDQHHQRYLRRVGCAAEHRLAEEHASQRHTVESTDEPVLLPRFDRVSQAHFEQPYIRLRHLVRDPGAVLTGSRRGTPFHHLKEAAIECDADSA